MTRLRARPHRTVPAPRVGRRQPARVGGARPGGAAGFVSGSIASGTLRGGEQGAFSGVLFGAVGAELHGMSPGLYGPAQIQGAGVMLHGVAGCVSSVAAGGQCAAGALSAGFAKAVTSSAAMQGINRAAGEGGDLGARIAGTAIAAVVGGTAAELGGGRFANGARAGAFGYLFNELAHQTDCVQRGFCSKVYRDGTVCPAGKACYNPLRTDAGGVLVGVTLEASTFVIDYSLTVDTDGRGYGSLGRSLLPNGDVGIGLKFHFAPGQWSSDQKFQFFDGMSATGSVQLGPVSLGRSYSPVAGTSRFVSTSDFGVGSPGLRAGGSVSLSTCLWGCPK